MIDLKFKEQSWFSNDMTAAWLLAAAAVLLQMSTNNHYGYFRDELYYLALSHHLDWGYVDLAPLAPFLLRVGRAVSPCVALADSLA